MVNSSSLSSNQAATKAGSVVASSARTTEPRPVHEGAMLPPQDNSSTMRSHQVPQGLLQDHIHKVGTKESCTQLQRRCLSTCCQSTTSPVTILHVSTNSTGIQSDTVKPMVQLQATIILHTINTTHQPTDKLSPLQDQASSPKYHHLTIEKGRKVQKNVCQLCQQLYHQRRKTMESVLHLSLLLSFVETSDMLFQNQFHHNIYNHPREEHRKYFQFF